MTLLQSSMLRNVSQIEGNGRKLSNSVQKKMVYQNHYHHSERETNVAESEPGFLSGTRADYSNFDFLLLLLI